MALGWVASRDGGPPVDPLIRAARARGRSFTDVEPLTPLELVARVPRGWSCAPSPSGVPACRQGDWSVSWAVDTEAASDSVDALVAREAAAQGSLERATLAGFRGVVAGGIGTLRPSASFSFRGWRDAPGGGRQRLTASAFNPLATDGQLEGLAVILTTTARAGIAPAASK